MNKYLLILLLVGVVGCKDGDDNMTPGEHLEAAFSRDTAVATEKKRYFFIGYLAQDGRGSHTYGNYYRIDDKIPQYDSLEKWAFEQAKGTAVSFNKFTITGFHEFKDSAEYTAFKNQTPKK